MYPNQDIAFILCDRTARSFGEWIHYISGESVFPPVNRPVNRFSLRWIDRRNWAIAMVLCMIACDFRLETICFLLLNRLTIPISGLMTSGDESDWPRRNG